MTWCAWMPAFRARCRPKCGSRARRQWLRQDRPGDGAVQRHGVAGPQSHGRQETGISTVLRYARVPVFYLERPMVLAIVVALVIVAGVAIGVLFSGDWEATDESRLFAARNQIRQGRRAHYRGHRNDAFHRPCRRHRRTVGRQVQLAHGRHRQHPHDAPVVDVEYAKPTKAGISVPSALPRATSPDTKIASTVPAIGQAQGSQRSPSVFRSTTTR